MGSCYKKDARYKCGRKSFKYRKPAVRSLLTAGVDLRYKKDANYKRAHKTIDKNKAPHANCVSRLSTGTPGWIRTSGL